MTFTDGYRVERVYFERLKSLITILKSLKDGVQDETVRTLIENAIDSDGAILLLYRNLGEAWAELADQVQKTRKMLQDLDEKTEKYHDELNERIDEVNNYLMALIRALEARMDAVEADLAQMGRLFTYDLQRANDEYTLTESGQPVTWAGTVEKVQHVRPHFVTVRGALDGEVTYLMPREYDTAQASGIFEWYSVGFVGNEIHEVTVTLLQDDSVNVAIHTTDFASILQRITSLETRMTIAEGDIDTLEQTAENHNDRITDLEECCDDMKENVIPGLQTAIAGKQDALTAGNGISIDPVTNEITNTSPGVIYTAGSGISIDPNTNEIANTAQGMTYTASDGIQIVNTNEIKNFHRNVGDASVEVTQRMSSTNGFTKTIIDDVSYATGKRFLNIKYEKTSNVTTALRTFARKIQLIMPHISSITGQTTTPGNGARVYFRCNFEIKITGYSLRDEFTGAYEQVANTVLDLLSTNAAFEHSIDQLFTKNVLSYVSNLSLSMWIIGDSDVVGFIGDQTPELNITGLT